MSSITSTNYSKQSTALFDQLSYSNDKVGRSLRTQTFSKLIFPTMRNFSIVVSLLFIMVSFPSLSSAQACTAGANEICGSVFEDFNFDGILDAVEVPMEGVTVTAYDDDGNIAAGPVSTEFDGSYILTGITSPVRIEFTDLPLFAEDGSGRGASNGSAIQFAGPGDSDINYGVQVPTEYCQEDMDIIFPCYVVGDGLNGGPAGNVDALVVVDYMTSGTNPADQTHISDAATIGSTWGTAYDQSDEKLYSASFLKRHVSLGPLGIDGIYLNTITGGTVGNSVPYFKLGDLGFVMDDLIDPRGLSGDPTQPSYDNEAFERVGAVGLGDLEIDPERDDLYVISLSPKKLVKVDLGTPHKAGAALVAGDLTSYDIPDPGCTNGNWRPFGMKFYRDKVYVGGICDATAGGTKDNLDWSVYEFDVVTETFNMTPLVTGTMNQNIDYVHGWTQTCSEFGPWTVDFAGYEEILTAGYASNANPNVGHYDRATSANFYNGNEVGEAYCNPQPMLSDIDFDNDGSMILSFMDRNGHTGSPGQYPYDPTETLNWTFDRGGAQIGGVLLYAQKTDTDTWTLESGGTTPDGDGAGANSGGGAGPGDPQYYNGLEKQYNGSSGHGETNVGGILQKRGGTELVVVGMDPVNLVSNGLFWLDNESGERTRGYEVFDNPNGGATSTGGAAKGNGLGEPELICSAAPIEIGNYVWLDEDNDGIQDPSEVALENVNVSLYDATGTLIGMTMTDANGAYYFNSEDHAAFLPNADYFVVVGDGQFANDVLTLDGEDYRITLATQTSLMMQDSVRDSDGTIADGLGLGFDGLPHTAVSVGGPGSVDHTLDFGFAPSVHDVALYKTMTDPTAYAEPGETISFDINVVNQGTDNLDSIVITDSFNIEGYNDVIPGAPNTFDWTYSSPGIGTLLASTSLGTAGMPIAAGDTATFTIVLRVRSNGAHGDVLANHAEISYSRDEAGKTGADDVDSTPDTDPTNDAGADSDSVENGADNETTGDGMGAPDDGIAATDEDDADPALPRYFDLALTKVVSNSSMPMDGVYDAGDTIVFEIQVFNQGIMDATNIVVRDSIPCGFEYLDMESPGWTGAYPEPTFNVASLAAGADTIIMISMELLTSMEIATDCAGTNINKWYRNYGLIESAQDDMGMTAVDIDSDAGSNTGAEQNTFPGTEEDNVLDSHRNGDIGSQDDHDPADINVFDLAISKELSPDNSPYTTGDLVTFEICVTNENMIFTDSIGIVDYLPAGYSYSATANNAAEGQAGWSYDMATREVTIAIVDFPQGDSLGFTDMVCVSLEVIVQVENDYENTAEINEARTIVNRLNAAGNVANQIISVVTSDNDGQFGDGMTTDDSSLDDDFDEEATAIIEIAYLSLGNQVWEDANNNGVVDVGEAPIQGAVVELHFFDPETMTCELVGIDTTDINGLYLFDSLGAGDYIVVLPASNFEMDGALAAYTSSTGSGPANLVSGVNEDIAMQLDPDTNPANVDDNGVLNGNSMFPGAVVSDTVSLLIGMEPENEGDGEGDDGNGGSVTTDLDNNLTVDFGFVPLHSIGNQVWEDANNNGVLDDGELALDSVLVILHYYDPATMTCIPLDSIYTNSDGLYLFDSLAAGQYLVELDDTNFAPGGPFENYVSSTNNGLDLTSGPSEDAMNPIDPDNNIEQDDNGILATMGPLAGGIVSDTIDLGNDEAQMAMETGPNNDMSGALDSLSNLTVDFGLVPLHSIGNQVWVDANNDGILDADEETLDGVTVVLHYVDPITGVCIVADTVVTSMGGLYLFDSLIMGDYIVEIPGPANNPALEGYTSSTGSGAGQIIDGPNENATAQIDPDNDVNGDDNGVLDGNAMFAGSIVSDTLSLGNGEPENDTIPNNDMSGAANDNSNLSVDFGFVPLHTIGNEVWVDLNNDGLAGDDELSVSGVVVELHYFEPALGSIVMLTTDTTNVDGLYLFDSLTAGDYWAVLATSNFAPGGALEGYVGSTGGGSDLTSVDTYENADSQIDPDGNVDNDDNGVLNGQAAFPGQISSDTISLGMDEATSEAGPNNDTSGAVDENSNLTIDFGVVPLHSLGNQVWRDDNNNGSIDDMEPAIADVLIYLHYYDPVTMTCSIIDSTLTDAMGEYLFDSLIAGQYVIEIPASNFESGLSPLNGYVSSTGSGPTDLTSGPYEDAGAQIDADNNTNLDDNGVLNGIPAFVGSVVSDTIDLGNMEPQMEGDTTLDSNNDMSGAFDSLSNLTIDFGFVPLHSIGNQVWIDADNDGLIGDDEIGLEGIEVVLHYYDPITMMCLALDTVLTDADGFYLFDSLIAGDYIVELTAENFGEDAVADGYISSTGGEGDLSNGPYEDDLAALDPDVVMDNVDDNGVLNGNAMFPMGSIASDTITIATDTEPTMEGENPNDSNNDDSGALDANSNLTVDFGLTALHTIGNQVWNDANNNGLIDTLEVLVEGVLVELHMVTDAGCVLVATDSTDVDGLYLFDSLLMGDYIVVIAASNFGSGGSLEGYVSSTGAGSDLVDGIYEDSAAVIDPDGNVESDDNGIMDGNAMFAGAIVSDTLSLGGSNEALAEDPNNDMSGATDANSNLTVDFGVVRLHSLGNQVWVDLDNDGIFDADEEGLEGVSVVLHFVNPETGACESVDTVVTGTDGFYLFDSLIMGQYIIEIPSLNFDDGAGALDGLTSSTGSGQGLISDGIYEDADNQIDPDETEDNLDDNGVLDGNAMFPGSVVSDTIDLGGVAEPLLEGDTAPDMNNDMSGALDSLSNLTIDFGFTPLMSLGNQVWIDANNDGIINDGEEGIDGVTVILHRYDAVTIMCVAVDTVFTMNGGQYIFENLTEGDYIVELPASNFDVGGVADGYISSTGGLSDLVNGPNEDDLTAIDPDVLQDNLDDNGVLNGNAMFDAGSIASDTITLEYQMEPLMEGDDALDSDNGTTDATDDNSNLTVDFGLTPLYSLGNTVWFDDNYNGIYDPALGEAGVDGVTVILHYVDPITGLCMAIDTTVTNSSGMYLFDSLLMGDYIVEIPATEIAPGGVLRDYLTSTGTFNMGGIFEDAANQIDPDGDVDRDDNGVFNGNSMFPGAVVSDTVTIGGMIAEPAGEVDNNDGSGANDDNSNLTVDFGFGQKVFDLAIRKELKEDLPAVPGDDVSFLITIFNQGNLDATNILVHDYIPAGLALAAVPENADWMAAGSDYTYLYEDTLAANTMDTIEIVLTILPTANPENVVNMVEIAMAQDTFGNDTDGNGPDMGVTDIDSEYDADNTNDVGNDLYSAENDKLDEDGLIGGDSDEHDQAWVNLCEAMVCKTSLNISLDEMCMAGLTADMLLIDNEYPEFLFEITAVDENGMMVDPQTFTGADIGMTFTVTIENTVCDDNFCQVEVTIEDKFPPQIMCDSDTITCGELIVFPEPMVTENCGTYTLTMLNETYANVDCSDPELQQIITREWIATDAAGNVSNTCMQTLSISKFDIGTVQPPAETQIPLECGVAYPMDANGGPDPIVYGSPRLGGQNLWPSQFLVCNLMVNYSDQTLQTSQNEISIVRTWTGTTWYCGQDSTVQFVQVFVIADNAGPEFTCPADMSFSSSGINCTADVVLPTLNITDLCGDVVDVDVQYEGGFIENSNGGNASLPMGTSVVTYTATDSNGNTNSCSFNVSVSDNEQPITVCEQFTTINLANDGLAIATAEMFDDGSFDACGPVTLTIRRMTPSCDMTDAAFGESVTFCCEDIGVEQMVVLRATDQEGNFNECMVSATIDDKIPPVLIQGLPDITLSCEFPFNEMDTEQFGSIVMDEDDMEPILLTADLVQFSGPATDGLVLGNCIELLEDEFTFSNFNSCGIGSATRVLIFTNAQGLTVTDVQNITFVNPSPFTIADIDFPDDYNTTNLCDVSELLPGNLTAAFSEPTFVEDGCDQIGFDYEDSVTDFSEGAMSCYQIIRTWTVADWCQTINGQFATWEGQQILTVTNNIAPEITGDCSDRELCSYDVECGPIYIELINAGMDDCTDSAFLNWTYAIDFDSDNTIDVTGNTADASGTYPVGNHTISWILSDGCGNQDDCSYTFELKNCKTATPICLQNLTAEIIATDTDGDTTPDTEQVTVNVNMFDGGSYHVCGSAIQLSFSADVNDVERTYGCDDVGEQPIQLWVTDVNGNQDFCTTSLEVQNNTDEGLCPAMLTVDVVGDIYTEMDEMIAKTEVMLEGGGTSDMTEEDGHYDFLDMPTGGSYVINPGKDIEHINGITTLDIILIQKHILGIEILDSPYKLIAADVNKSDNITGQDIILIRKLILGHNADFPGNTSWRFIDSDHTFLDPTNPWIADLPESYTITDLAGDMIVNFTGVKIGDVNNSALPNELVGEQLDTRSNEKLNLAVDYAELTKGSTQWIQVYADEFSNMSGMQIGLNLSDDVRILDVKGAALELVESNYSIDSKKNELAMIWHNADATSVSSDKALFEIQVKVLADVTTSRLITTDDQVIRNEAYDQALQITDIAISTRSDDRASMEISMEMTQNEPNPWNTSTTIEINVAKGGNAAFRVMDMSGKVVYTQSMDLEAGTNELLLTKDALPATGVLYYEVEMAETKLMKKMVLLK